jgi:hypothetical protein
MISLTKGCCGSLGRSVGGKAEVGTGSNDHQVNSQCDIGIRKIHIPMQHEHTLPTAQPMLYSHLLTFHLYILPACPH